MTTRVNPPSTIYDVATMAGVSISTVSLALNSPNRVKPATLSRVLAAIDELGFVPKSEAVTRARRGIGRIGVIAPFTTYASFARRLNGVLRAVRAHSCEVVVYDQESAASSQLATLPLTRRLDGLIVMSLPFSDEIAERLADQNIDTVLVEVVRDGFSSVTIDDTAGGRMVAELLMARGHERFAFIGEEQQSHHYLSQSESRLSGFREALAARGRRLPDANVRTTFHSLEAAEHAAGELLDLPEPPTAIFAHDDLLASAALKVARQRSLAVPDDLAVVGFDDSDIAQHLGLTSVRQPLEESGALAADTLLAQMADHGRPRQRISLELTLVERETT
jgi:DNA-binding LacI/PurR family transcriptional regulator